jgi:hypothetical protein
VIIARNPARSSFKPSIPSASPLALGKGESIAKVKALTDSQGGVVADLSPGAYRPRRMHSQSRGGGRVALISANPEPLSCRWVFNDPLHRNLRHHGPH